MATKLGRMAAHFDGLLPIKSYHFLITFVRSRDKLKPLYLPYHSAYDHETSKNGDLS